MLARQILKLVAGMVVLLLSGACGSKQVALTATSVPISVVQFLPFQNPWGNWQVEDTEFSLAVGVYAQSKDVAFLLGDLGVPAGASRSTLLRSTDEGQHWVEVMEPVSGSSLIEMEMIAEGTGWALVMWTIEGPGNITLYHTADYGKNWQELSTVPKWQWYGYPIKMDFYDKKHGQIDMVYDGGEPSTNRIAYITTSDGGLTWKENGSIPLDSFEPVDDEKDNYFEARITYIQENSKDYSQSIGQDGSLWKVDYEDDTEQIFIRRRLDTGDWITMSILPQYFGYSDDQVVVP